ncbi:MAG: high-affinity nickel-transport family protein [Candidatus Levybacteria bacterium]|nr:high-affinity nickel-transport family protein [Candidatus Levybacteria bacterium]
MSMFLSILGLGFLLGIRHATDADHVVAITTMISKEKAVKHAAIIGIFWGIGHSLTVTFIAIPIILFSLVIPPRIGLGLEFIVGIMLVTLGILNLSGIASHIAKRYTSIVHSHEHECPEGGKHTHLHAHKSSPDHDHSNHLSIFQIVRPLIVGLIHGLAGSAAIALLILSTIHDPKQAILYLLLFHVGVVTGMMIITTLMGASVKLAKQQGASVHKYLVIASGILSILFGLFVMYETGIVDGLFSATVHWSPK